MSGYQQTKNTTNGIINQTGRTYKLKELKTKPAVEGSGKSKPAVEGSKKTIPAVEGSGKTKPAVEGSGKTKPAVEGSGKTKPAVKRSGKCKPAVEGSEKTKPAVEGSEKSKPAVEGSKKTIPAVKRSGKTKPAVERSGKTKLAVKGSGKCKPAVEGSGKTKPAEEGSGKTKPAVEGSGKTKPAVEGSGKTKPAVEGSGKSKPAVEGSGKTKPAVEGSGKTGTKQEQKTKKGKPKHKTRQTELKDEAETWRSVVRLADDPEIIDQHSEMVKAEKHLNRKRKKTKENLGAIQTVVYLEESEIPCVVEPAERIFQSQSRKSQLDESSGPVEGRKTNKRLCRESDLHMDTVPSDGTSSDCNDPQDAGAMDETEHEAEDPQSTTSKKMPQHCRCSLKQTGTRLTVSPKQTGTRQRVSPKETGTRHRTRRRGSPLSEKEWQAMNELKVFIPNIESKTINVIRLMIKYDLERFKEFQRQGFPLRTGRFTAQENKQLCRNINSFLAVTGIDSASKLFHTKRFKDEYRNIQKLKRLHEFPMKIAEGLRRPWINIYFRCGRKMFDGSSYQDRRWFSQDDMNDLKKLQKVYGNNWVKISQLTGRSEVPLRKSFSRMYANLGAWSKEEMTSLLDAVRDHLAGVVEPGSEPAIIRKEKLYKNVPWTEMSQRVKTRHRDQCRMKWLGHLNRKMTCGQSVFSRGLKCLQYKVNLIKALNSSQVQDATDIDWEHIANTVGRDVTPYHVQMHFNKLRVSKVPLCQSITFCEIIDYLYSRVLPRFEELLQLVQMELMENEAADRPREFFLLSEIFDDEDNRSFLQDLG